MVMVAETFLFLLYISPVNGVKKVDQVNINNYVMKKLLIVAMALLVSGTLLAQESKTKKKESKSFIVLHAGPSFPVGDFSSTNTDNLDAGFAKTGVNINLTYGYEYQKNLGVVASLLYNRNPLNKGGVAYKDETSGQQVVLNLDHWQFYGVAAGPMLTFNIGEKVNTDFKVMVGAVNANAPKISYQGVALTNDAWNVAPVYMAGLSVRINAGKNIFIMAGADYMYLRPTLKYEFSNIIASQIPSNYSDYFKQKMSVVNVTAGVGFKF
jgi:opacity protein-like surface antigen